MDLCDSIQEQPVMSTYTDVGGSVDIDKVINQSPQWVQGVIKGLWSQD